MANNDTEIGISIDTNADKAAQKVDLLSEAWARMQKAAENTTERAMKAFNDSSMAVKRYNDANMAQVKKKVGDAGKLLTDMATRFETENMLAFNNTLSVVTGSVDNLMGTLRRFSKFKDYDFSVFNKLGEIKLSNVNTEKITEMSAAFEKMRNAQIEKTSRALLQFTTAMERMGTLNFNTNMTGNIQSQMNAAATTLKGFMDKLQGFNFDGFSRLATDIAKVPKAMKQMESLQMDKIGKVFTTLATQIQPFIAHLKEASAEILGLANLTSAIGKFNSGMKQVKQTTKDTGLEADKTHKKINNMLTFGKVYAFYNQARHYGQGVLNILNKSVDFTEIENYFSRAMGNMRGEAIKFQETLSESFGMAMPDMMKAQATYKNMLGSLGGLSDDMTYMLSERIMKMTLDYASLYNVTIDSAITKFQASLSKQVRPIRSTSGYDITQNVLESTAQSIGINDRSIQQMGEMEKRLLIILTLQDQMSKSSAIGDFTDTLSEPANQIKVLQQQISEIGRWISSVFYGVIRQVLPYINGFAMAIKEIVKAFALFVGYEMPDSSKKPGTIIDNMGDSMDGFGSSVDDANSALDDTAKKAEKAAKITSRIGFDEFNTVSKPSDSDSGSGSDGAGAGSIDPRILDALSKIDYMFGNVWMKANDIRDAILGWMDAFGKVLNENIFEPISNSWNKYGASVSSLCKEQWDDMMHIISGIVDVLSEKWKPFFQAFTDLYFSVDETFGLIGATITNFFRIVWDNGGKYLFEGIFDLGTAFLNLATKINDKFVKPLIHWFKDNIVPIIGSAVGAILGLIGKLLSGLGGIIDWISECTPLVVIFGGALTGMFTAFKIAKILELSKAFTGTHKILRAMVDMLYEHNGLFKKVADTVMKAKINYDGFKGTIKAANDVLSNTKVWTTIKGCIDKAAGAMMNFGDTMIEGGGKVSGFVGKAIGGIGTLLSWLAANPIVALAVAIGTAVALLAGFALSQQDATRDITDCSDAIQEQYKKFTDLSDSVSKAGENIDKQIDSTKVQTGLAKDYIDVLRKMSDEDGYVKNIEDAGFYVDEINKILPETVKLTEDGRLAWQKTPEEIEKTIESTIKLAKAQAYQEAYIESTKDIIEQQRLLQIEQDNLASLYDDARRKYNNYLDDYEKAPSTMRGAKKSYEEWMETIYAGNDAIKDQTVLFEEASKKTDESVQKNKFFNDGLMNLDSTLDTTSESTENLAIKTGELSANFETNKAKILSDLLRYNSDISKEDRTLYMTLLENLDRSGFDISTMQSGQHTAMLDAIKNHNLEVNSEEALKYASLLQLLQDSGVNLSTKQYEQYQAMMIAMKDNGIALGSEQEKQYAQGVALLEKHGYDMSDKENLQHVARLIKAGISGEAEGEKFIEMLKSGTASNDLDPELETIMGDAKKVVEGDPLTVGIDIENIEGKIETIADFLKSDAVRNKLKTVVGIVLDVKNGTASAKGYATGGFPNIGQMFVAREAGPEFVGSLGGHTAVANNYQIEAGVARGVAQGMSASGGGSSQPQIVESHVTVELDGEVVAKAVDKSKAKKGWNFGMG